MRTASEDIVTKILSYNEILDIKKQKFIFTKDKSNYNLGEYLKTARPEPSKYGARYIFIK